MKTAIIWLRRDLRLNDHAALSAALIRHERVVPAFIFDRAILDPLPRDDRRVAFIRETLAGLKAALQEQGSDLVVRVGDPCEEIPRLALEYGATTVYANRDYEPAAIARDGCVAERLAATGTEWEDFKDQVLFDRDEVLTRSGTPFSVFTPYWRQWRARLSPADVAEYPVAPYLSRLARLPLQHLPGLAELGFSEPADPIRIAAGRIAKLESDYAADAPFADEFIVPGLIAIYGGWKAGRAEARGNAP